MVPKRVVFDIDGVIADGTKEKVYSNEAGWAYEKCIPISEGVALVRGIKNAGHIVVLNTARWSIDYEKTIAWLRKYEVPFDELIMGKPSASLYIDDRGYRFSAKEVQETGFAEVLDEILCILGES